MKKKYIVAKKGVEIKFIDDKIYLRITNTVNGMLEQGGHVDQVYLLANPDGITYDNLDEPINDYGTTHLERLIEEIRDTKPIRL